MTFTRVLNCTQTDLPRYLYLHDGTTLVPGTYLYDECCLHEWNNLFGGLLPPCHNVQCLGFVSSPSSRRSLKFEVWLIADCHQISHLLCNASSSMIDDDDPKPKQTDTIIISKQAATINNSTIFFFKVEPHTTKSIQNTTTQTKKLGD